MATPLGRSLPCDFVVFPLISRRFHRLFDLFLIQQERRPPREAGIDREPTEDGNGNFSSASTSSSKRRSVFVFQRDQSRELRVFRTPTAEPDLCQYPTESAQSLPLLSPWDLLPTGITVRTSSRITFTTYSHLYTCTLPDSVTSMMSLLTRSTSLPRSVTDLWDFLRRRLTWEDNGSRRKTAATMEVRKNIHLHCAVLVALIA